MRRCEGRTVVICITSRKPAFLPAVLELWISPAPPDLLALKLESARLTYIGFHRCSDLNNDRRL